MKRPENLYKIDYLLVGVIILIVGIGCLLIYSGGFDPIEKINNGLYKRQIIWFIIGLVVMIAFTFISYHQIGDYAHYIYAAVLVLLLFTTLFGSSVRNIRAWLNFGLFSIQPAEFMKLAVVILLAKLLEMRERDIKHFREILLPALIILVPVVIILNQPDFGTAVVFIPILFTMLFVGGADISHLVSIILVASIALVLPMALTYSEWVGDDSSNIIFDFFKNTNRLFIVSGILFAAACITFVLRYIYVNKMFKKIYIPCGVLSLGLLCSVLIQNFFKLYQKRRILVFLNPELDPQASGYHIIQSKIAIGSGGFLGKGFLQGSQAQLGFLPEKTSDFIFSVAAEEWGFLGAVILLLLLGFVMFRGIQTALEAKDKFGALLASGITSIMFFHILINIGMVIGVMPVTGLPLCFVSYGGSNLMMCMISIGILINIRTKKHVY
ncbi:MAG: rod shape-determining protein RodA [Spirochaetia bacterium]|jgi:rod shape determining protein RodA|nr:rod shape-determining protein RodA [Spirochaetia bacterium]